MLKIVNQKIGSDGNNIDRDCKNVCLTDVEINFLLRLLEDQAVPFARNGFSDFSLEYELINSLEHSDTQFEG